MRRVILRQRTQRFMRGKVGYVRFSPNFFQTGVWL
jgi:hypothetical protein